MAKYLKGYAVVGARYGDEGKGLAVDYIASQSKAGDKILNIKSNGGSQSGHTVCRLQNATYRHWVFHSIGSATLIDANAVTYLPKQYMLDFSRLLIERQKLEEIYGLSPNVVIDVHCGVVLPMDTLINQILEDTRQNRHGSCGLGIFEQFNRSNNGLRVEVADILKLSNHTEIVKYLTDIQSKYLELRKSQVNTELAKESKQISDVEWEQLFVRAVNNTERLVQDIDEGIGWIYGCALPEWSTIDFKRCSGISVVDGLRNEIRDIYNIMIWECGQGLELDKDNKDNWPHLTPSNTGTQNMASMINEYGLTDAFDDISIYYISRSYETKHGAGTFNTYDKTLQIKYGLWDRTNKTNEYQGGLRYGRLNLQRMKKLVTRDFENFKSIHGNSEFNISGNLMITHLDQTNGLLICTDGVYPCSELRSKDWTGSADTYYSYGDKSSDIVKVTAN